MKNPNILFIQVDQMMATSLRAYGNTLCHAPTLDQLAASGVVFENAYCNFPLCAPSRFSMATGKLCSAVGAYDNAAEFPSGIPSYAHYLRAMGYQTSLSGKMHFIGPDQYHGFERRLTADLYPADFSWVPNWGDEGKRDTNDPRSVLISGVCERSVQIDFDDQVTACAVQELYDITRSKDHRPFFLQVSYTHPHEPYLCQPEFWDLYADVAIPLPAVPALKESEHDAHSVRLLQDFGMLNVEFEEADIRRARRAYYGSISYLDHMIARVLATLKATGLDKHTAIIFTSDHGEMLGERGMWFKKHFFEPALRIPLLLSAPWLQPQRVSELVSLVDLLPTFCGLASGTVWSSDVEILDGMDLGQFLTGSPHGLPPTTWTRPVYVEYLAEATTAPVFMIRRGQYKYIQASTDPALLFDVVNDPLERHNLAGKAEHADRVAQFSQEVAGKWDEVALSRDIRLSQQRRRLIRETSRNGTPIRWNHGEESGQDVRWYRGQGSYNDWAFDYLPVLSDR